MKIVMTFFFFAIISVATAQQRTPWSKWQWLLGEWRGEGSGNPGQGSGAFSFKPDLDNKILVRKAHSKYTSPGNRLVHNDLLFVYLNASGDPSRAIYFDNEGHTINYTITYSDSVIVLLSDKAPGLPTFRLTYTLLNDKRVNTKFELSQDGQNFMTYVEGKSIKIK